MKRKRFLTINFKEPRRCSPPTWCRGCGGVGNVYTADTRDIVEYLVGFQYVRSPRISQFKCPTCNGKGVLDEMIDDFLFNFIDPDVFIGLTIRGRAVLSFGEMRGNMMSGELYGKQRSNFY